MNFNIKNYKYFFCNRYLFITMKLRYLNNMCFCKVLYLIFKKTIY